MILLSRRKNQSQYRVRTLQLLSMIQINNTCRSKILVSQQSSCKNPSVIISFLSVRSGSTSPLLSSSSTCCRGPISDVNSSSSFTASVWLDSFDNRIKAHSPSIRETEMTSRCSLHNSWSSTNNSTDIEGVFFSFFLSIRFDNNNTLFLILSLILFDSTCRIGTLALLIIIALFV